MSTPDAPDPVSTPPLSTLALTTPVAMGYIPLGMVFGFLFVQAGSAGWLAVLTSLFVYAGAAQYLMIPMIAAGLPLGAIALATLVINVRHVFYGLSLLDRFPRTGWLRWYLIFALTDETYSVLTTLPANTPPRRLAWIALLNQGWWVLGSALGALIGAQARLNLSGLDFVLAALFAVLAVEQWRSRKSPAPLWIALIAYALAWPLTARHALPLSIALSLLAGVFWQSRSSSPAEPSHDR